MKIFAVFALVLIFTVSPQLAEARKGNGYSGFKSYGFGSSGRSHSVRPHLRKDGSYIGPSRRTNPDGTKMNNYGTRGNVNPYTGKTGTKDPSGK